MPYFTTRPQVLHAFQWTGSNFTELETWAAEFAPYALPMVNNGDGSITLSENSGGWSINTDDWLSNQGPLANYFMYQMQEVLGEGPYSFDITSV